MKPTAWLKELVPEKGMEWQVKMTTIEEVAKDWEEPVTPLYAKRDWVGLTDEEIILMFQEISPIGVNEFAKAIEAKLKEKNTP